MFQILKNLFGSTDSSALVKALEEGAQLVDVRSSAEFASGSVKGAINIPLDSLLKNAGKLKGKKGIVVFCKSGGRSAMAKSMLESKGFSNVVNGGSWTNVAKIVNG